MSDNRTRVFVCCPDCGLAYHQWVTGPYIGPRKRPRLDQGYLRLCATEAGQVEKGKPWHGVMRCTACSLKLAPPSLRDQLEKWLLHGEQGGG